MGILSILIFLPLPVIILLLALPERFRNWYKWISLGTCIIQLALSCFLYAGFKRWNYASFISENAFQLKENIDWIHLNLGSLGQLNIRYFVGVDGISLGFLILSSIVFVIACLASWNISKNLKGYFSLFLLLNMAVLGVFCSLDFFLFYIFYELMLLPLYFLIGMWGGPRREYAAIKFFIYTLLGSVLMLIVMIGLYFSSADPVTGHHTFNILSMGNPLNFSDSSLLSPHNNSIFLFGQSARNIAFLLLFISFAIKVPIVPLHTWLPDAHVEAPTAISIVLAGLILKVGGYGMIRICYGIFPDAAIHFSWWIGLLGVISIIYGALNALAQKDLKKLVAYSSVSHMGFVLLGLASLTAEGVTGAIMQMYSHGILSSMLFFIVGVIYERVQNREIQNFSGISLLMPKFTTFAMIGFFASLGLPGFSAFIAELFTLTGAFKSHSINQLLPHWMAVAASLGILLAAAYFLWAFQRIFFGELKLAESSWKEKLKDLSGMEKIVLVSLSIITLAWGIFPSLIFSLINTPVLFLVEFVKHYKV